ncbi:hypothetical protein D1872_200240 [compost metagenome]
MPVPGPLAVIKPSAVTSISFALSSSTVQTIFLLVAFDGVIVASSCLLSPTNRDNELGVMDIPFTATVVLPPPDVPPPEVPPLELPPLELPPLDVPPEDDPPPEGVVVSTGFPFNVVDEPLSPVTLFTLTVPVITALASATNSLIVPFAVILISAARFTTLLKFPSNFTS